MLCRGVQCRDLRKGKGLINRLAHTVVVDGWVDGGALLNRLRDRRVAGILA